MLHLTLYLGTDEIDQHPHGNCSPSQSWYNSPHNGDLLKSAALSHFIAWVWSQCSALTAMVSMTKTTWACMVATLRLPQLKGTDEELRPIALNDIEN